MHHGDGCSPVALPRNQPVAQAVGDSPLAPICVLYMVGDSLHTLGRGKPIEPTRVHHNALARIGFRQRLPRPVRRRNHYLDGEAGLGGELEVTLVVGRHSHDGAGAVGHEDVVRDEAGAPARRSRRLMA